MPRGYVPLLLALSALWGGSFMFIKVALEGFEPTTMMAARLALAAVPLFTLLAFRSGLRRAAGQLRAVAREGFVLGVINSAVPFTLIAWGEQHVDSGVAAIANASVPIFVALLAIRFQPSERVSGGRLAGIALGIAGVGVLAGVDPRGGWLAVAGMLAVVAASISYAIGSLYGQRQMPETGSLVLATATTIAGALVLLPLGLLQLPDDVPSAKAVASLAALSFLGTVVGLLLFFRMLALYGSSRSSLVTYLLPAVALFYGAVLLSEPITATMLIGLALILVGIALGSGTLRPARRAAAVSASR